MTSVASSLWRGRSWRERFRDNALSIAALGLFFVTFAAGQTLTGFREYNNDQRAHNEQVVGLGEYLRTGHFREATFENWESEFLQMGLYVLLTAYLVQRGSAESKKPKDEGDNSQDVNPRTVKITADTPWPVRAKGMWLTLYENSLAIFFMLLFLFSMLMHANGGAADYNAEQEQHGEAGGYSTFSYMATARFWFESLQNWQSEFLAIASIVLASIWLRQKGSPESKPVHAPYSETGS
ncbi:MAG: DUF6766 family protein [Mycobacteriales bacterium]